MVSVGQPTGLLMRIGEMKVTVLEFFLFLIDLREREKHRFDVPLNYAFDGQFFSGLARNLTCNLGVS